MGSEGGSLCGLSGGGEAHCPNPSSNTQVWSHSIQTQCDFLPSCERLMRQEPLKTVSSFLFYHVAPGGRGEAEYLQPPKLPSELQVVPSEHSHIQFFFLPFSATLRHMHVPKPGIKSEMHLQQHQILNPPHLAREWKQQRRRDKPDP